MRSVILYIIYFSLLQAFALHESLEKEFLALACLCEAVICCRVTPLQKVRFYTIGCPPVWISGLVFSDKTTQTRTMWSWWKAVQFLFLALICFLFARYVLKVEEWSSQLIFQFKQLQRRSLKKSGLQWDSNPWPPRYRCDALPTELWSHIIGSEVNLLSSYLPWGVNDVKYIWSNSYIWTAVVDES